MGPLAGIKVIEIAGLGAAPFCGMVLSDLGAEVIQVGRVSDVHTGGGLVALMGQDGRDVSADVLNRGRRSVTVDLRHAEGPEVVLSLLETADALIESFRPGVMERLGLGSDACMERNPRLVYGRMTGWGQDGPYAQAAGHDINYIALAGALEPLGRRNEPPLPPLNLLADFGGGGMLLALGITAAILEASRSGRGQVVDAAMVDGAALLTTMMHGLRAMGVWTDERGSNFNDTGAHFYNVYETEDRQYVAVGAIEPKFYAELVQRVGLNADDLPEQWDREAWPGMQRRLAAMFAQKTRDEWCQILEHTDACFAPVLSFREAPHHPHNMARETFQDVAGVVQPAPAPRFSRTSAAIQAPPPRPGQHTDQVLGEAGFSQGRIEALRAAGVVA
jgi:alpha-methylacyl-CoA racemase